MEQQQIQRFTMIPNELVEALCRARWLNYRSRVVLAIIRLTYGYRRTQAQITLEQFSTMTEIKKPHICKALRELLKGNIITKYGNDKYGLQTIHLDWKSLPNMVTLPNVVTSVTESGNKSLPNMVTHKDVNIKIKENLKKEGAPKRGKYKPNGTTPAHSPYKKEKVEDTTDMEPEDRNSLDALKTKLKTGKG